MELSESQITLILHIRAENAKTRAWVDEDPDNRMAFTAIDNAEHWAKYGVTSVAEFKLYNARAELWDWYKEVHGIRPRWMNVWDMSLEEVEEELAALRRYSEMLARDEAAREEAEKAATQREADLLSESPKLENPVLTEFFLK